LSAWKLSRRRSTLTWCSRAVNRARLSLRATSRTRSNPADTPARLCVRGVVGWAVFPSVGRLPPSVDGPSWGRAIAALNRSYSDQKLSPWPPSFAGCSGTTRPSDSPRSCASDVRHNAFSDRPADAPSSAGDRGASRFPCGEFPRVPRGTSPPRFRVCDCAGPTGGSPLPPPVVWPSARVNGVGVPDRLITQLDTWPACAPVNASPAASRPTAHDSGSVWLAGPSPCDSFIHNSSPVLTGALTLQPNATMFGACKALRDRFRLCR
jgi:hypothetical protein